MGDTTVTWGSRFRFTGCAIGSSVNPGIYIIGVGPYTNFGFEAFFKEGGRKENLYKTGKGAGVPAMKDSDTGFAFKLGYEFASGLQLNAAYKVSMTDVADANSGAAELRPQSFSFGIAYRWGK